jgi:hypothetical protein
MGKGRNSSGFTISPASLSEQIVLLSPTSDVQVRSTARSTMQSTIEGSTGFTPDLRIRPSR